MTDGGQAQFLVTQAASSFFVNLHLIGRSGAIALRARNFVQFEIEVVSNAIATYREPTIIRPSLRQDHITMMLVPELEEFASSINERQPPSITATDGRRVLSVLDAVMESARDGRAVELNAPALGAV